MVQSWSSSHRFLSEKHLNPCFKILAEQNKLIYYPYICRQVESDDSGITGDIVVSNDQVESVLKIVNFLHEDDKHYNKINHLKVGTLLAMKLNMIYI
ncbi:hypothetical protein HSBAA_63800 [Vreelandella sulfidaeris]|uniref:Uncharacterized protein n=1 Tax=Vreelandella sulfidaeris TaxID=115553 RepID=A0A455UQ75_9GAMM|nr:hypothetical protein HSBAA_63800 [Halomonas sulfidaeris]